MTTIHTKVCKACSQEKPLTDFFGPYTDARTGQQKWKGTCKACLPKRKAVQPAGSSKWELARERRLRDYPGSKVCTDCDEEKPLADFGQPSRRDQAGGRVALVFSPRCLACQSKAVMARQARKAGSSA
jgi:hypothetical protein